ncbi:DUF6460 domain-containing protein [Coralliovum pocilloporae]|uniref:DUF6460 domain-containing protein n=1 Tax=Coralliovum pocilloporae TaxID=3066369 RepID=UPI003307A431
MLLRILSTITKVGLASLITGAVLTQLDLQADQVLADLGVTPETMHKAVETALVWTSEWAVPNIILGSIVIIPVWIVLYLFRPPRG